MSRRASFFARTQPGVRRVRFPDEIVFHESIKESDGEAVIRMLRRVSVDIDINRITMSGMTAIHQAVVDNNLVLVRLLHIHGADLNKTDSDSWTPLHAAAANGYDTIVSYLLSHGADRNKRTEDGETALDLVEEEDVATMAVLQDTKDEVEVARRLSVAHVVRQERKEPAWVRRMSLQEAARKESVKELEVDVDTRRKGSAWVGKEEIPEEEETDEEEKEEEGEIKTQSVDVKPEEEIKRDSKTVRLKPPAPLPGPRQRRTGRLGLQLSVRPQFLSQSPAPAASPPPPPAPSPAPTLTPLSGNKCSEKIIVLSKTKSLQIQSEQKMANEKDIARITESKSTEIKSPGPKVCLIGKDLTQFSGERPSVISPESKDR